MPNNLDPKVKASLDLLINLSLVSDAEIHIFYKEGGISVVSSLKKGYEKAMVEAAIHALDKLVKKIDHARELKEKERYVDSL